jgi:hypothetical protein
MRTAVALISALAFSVVVLRPASLPAEVSDAHLIGEWIGTWTSGLYQGTGLGAQPTPRGIRNNGDYRLTISKVADGKVYGRVQQPGLPLPEFDFVGTLDQNVISYGNERMQTQLTVDGDHMTGTRLGGPTAWHLSLQKKK